MNTVVITNNGIEVTILSPYDPAFPPEARQLGGRWDPMRRLWTFAPEHESRVRDLARRIYGTDGNDTADEPPVTVHLDLDKLDSTYTKDNELRVSGHLLASRRERDANVRLGRGVIVIEGGFPSSGGSRNNPRLWPESGTVLEISGLPRAVAERMVAETDAATFASADDLNRAALLVEREKLTARIAEIDALLEKGHDQQT